MAGTGALRRLFAQAGGDFELSAGWIAGAVIMFAAGKLERLALTYHGKYETLTDTYYMVAHDRYALRMAAMFALFAVIYYAMPRYAGYGVSRVLGWTHFALTFGGVMLSFGAVEALYIVTPPERFSDLTGLFTIANTAGTIGAYMALAGFVVFIIAIADAFVRKRPRVGAQITDGRTT